MVFYGCAVTDPEIAQLFNKHQESFQLFDRIIEHKTGDYKHFPCNCSPIHQPYVTMMVMDILRGLWIQKLIDDQEKIARR